ncbi:virulence factor Mce family protein [Aeromicrobium marinum DSM 15272]|uniref:Virulence factor Mce family protein n=1 Tax=Aeromicrobium marinum DSM 15272 TaxID=585531 RepID=E2SCQ5_9ACTN|nr:MCE family protein [Aeromicrobium marinum]EFQ83008.1 virulence factor Mce family protein [Aeromicrobium marinum DSM 15272]
MSAAHISRDLAEKRSALAQRGLIALVLLVLAVGFLAAVGGGMFADRQQVVVEVDDIGGALTVGNDVKIKGVIIGRVDTVERRGDVVRLGLQVRGDEADRLPAGVTARVLPATVFGTSFVDLVPPPVPTGERLAAGAVIPQDASSQTLELQDALDRSYDILTSVEPARLSATLGAFADALDGRGEELGSTLESLDSLLGQVQPEIPLIREDLRLLATNMQTVAEIAPELFDATDDSLVAMRTVVEKRAQITSLIAGGSALVTEARRVADDTAQSFVDAIDQSAVIVQTMFDERRGFPETFRALVALSQGGQQVFGNGPFMSTDVYIRVGNAQPYTAADCPRYGPAVGDNCADAAAAGTGSGAADAAAPGEADRALVVELQTLLADLERAGAADPGGVGAMLARPYLGPAAGGDVR